jgi:hypothetical protein
LVLLYLIGAGMDKKLSEVDNLRHNQLQLDYWERGMSKINSMALTIILSWVLPSLSLAAAQKPYVYTSCPTNYKAWLKRGRHWMAFAQSATVSGGNVCGWSIGHSTRARAIAGAMGQCRLAQKENPTWSKKGTCHIIEIK